MNEGRFAAGGVGTFKKGGTGERAEAQTTQAGSDR
jgi:hypothetical protein